MTPTGTDIQARVGARPPLVIRADAGRAMGSGHVMRTLALAQAWRLAGGSVTYVACDLPSGLGERLSNEGCRVVRGDGVKPGGVDDARRLRETLEEVGAGALVVDGYHFGEAFRREVSRVAPCSLLVHDFGIDDALWLDFVLDQNPHARRAHYPGVEASRVLLGLRWALLRREFVEALRGVEAMGSDFGPIRVLVTFGGSDPRDLTTRVLHGLEGVDRALDIRVVVGPAYRRPDALREAAGGLRHRVHVLEGVSDMPSLMAWADLAVAACGSTSWELTWMEVPWLAIAVASNQRPILRALAERGMATGLGWHEEVDEAHIARGVEALAADLESGRLPRAAAPAVDGRGADRVAALLRGQG